MQGNSKSTKRINALNKVRNLETDKPFLEICVVGNNLTLPDNLLEVSEVGEESKLEEAWQMSFQWLLE